MRPPVTATIGGREFRLQLTGQTFEDADAEGVDLIGLIDAEAFKPSNVCTFLYWAARKHHPDVTRAEMLDLVDFRDLRDLSSVAASLIRSSSDGEDEGKPEQAAAGKPQRPGR